MSEQDKSHEKTVAVIGGGIAGITAAIKLQKRGYSVTLFERESVLGGNLSSNSKDNSEDNGEGGRKDVYPHIFGDWYDEFWTLLETDFGLKREEKFLARNDVRMAIIPAKNHRPKGFGDMTFATVSTPTTLSNLVNNAYCDVLSARDMFLFGYTYLDLISVPPTAKRTSKLLEDLDVTGYLYSRPYMNNEIADFHDDILKIIWSMPSDLTSAKAYQKLIRHTLTFPKATPFAWLIKGPLNKTLLDPITEELRKAGCEIRTDTTVARIAIDPSENTSDKYKDRKYKYRDEFVELTIKDVDKPERFGYAVIATPARMAGELALGDGSERSLVHRKAVLARLREAETGRIPVVYLYFNDKFLEEYKEDLKSIPDELTGFKHRKLGRNEKILPEDLVISDNGYDISIHNIAKVWEPEHLATLKPNEPVFVVAASRATAIKAPGPEETKGDKGEVQGWEMLQRFKEYFPFIELGNHWNDEKNGHIDWTRTRVITNENHQLFLNDTGSNEWRPKVKLQDSQGHLVCQNVFFAGDYCMTDVDMATVEAAVQSGVLAAQALLWENDRDNKNMITLQRHTVYGPEAMLVAKLVSTPAAFLAALSALHDEAGNDPIDAIKFPFNAASVATAYWADWLRSAIQLGGHLLPNSEEQNEGPVGYSGRHDRKIGVVGLAANVARALVVEGPHLPARVKDDAAEALYSAWYSTIGRAMFPDIRKTLRDPDKPRPSYVRRHHRPEETPSTWSGLVGKALGDSQDTAATASDVGFAIASSAVDFLQNRGTLQESVAKGAEAYKRRTDR